MARLMILGYSHCCDRTTEVDVLRSFMLLLHTHKSVRLYSIQRYVWPHIVISTIHRSLQIDTWMLHPHTARFH